MSEHKATWDITLDAECPACGEDIDLMCVDGFMDDAMFQAGEHDTHRTQDVDAYCPDCGHDFKVDFQY